MLLHALEGECVSLKHAIFFYFIFLLFTQNVDQIRSTGSVALSYIFLNLCTYILNVHY